MRLPLPQRAQLGTGALVLAALAVGQVINAKLPADDVSGRAFEHHVVIDKTLHMRSGDLTVRSIEGAKSVKRSDGGGFLSPGVIVVVSFDFTSHHQRSSISYGELRTTDGGVTTIGPFGDRANITCPQSQVGILTHCQATVEAAPATLAGASLALAPLSIDPRFDDMAVIDLKITKAMAQEWSKRPGPLDMSQAGADGMP